MIYVYFLDMTTSKVPFSIEMTASFLFTNSLLTHRDRVLGNVKLFSGYLAFMILSPVHSSDNENTEK